MRAIVLQDGGKLQFDPAYRDPQPGDGEIAIDVIRAGICETDLQLSQGYMGFTGVLGHEFIGVARSGKWQGRRVVGEINCACHRCPTCLRGDSNHCPNRTVIGILQHDGAFADTLCVPEANLHVVPDELSDEEAIFAEPVAAAFEIPSQITIRPEQSVCVLGDGRLGNLSAQVLLAAGANVTVVGKHPEKLSRRELSSATTILLDELTPEHDKSFEVVVDCTGSSGGLETALRLARPRGTVVLKTTVAQPYQIAMAPVVIDELTIVGSRCGPFSEALEALRSRRVDVSQMISAHYRLERFAEAFDHAQRPDALKVVFEIG